MQTFCMFIKLKENNHFEHIASAAVLWVCYNNFMELHFNTELKLKTQFINLAG